VYHLPATPLPFTVVDLMALFGAVARAPLSVMFMPGEMTGGYEMLVPAMIAVGLAYIMGGHNTIYESQVPTPADSPAHRLDYYFPVLRETRVKDVMRACATGITPRTPLAEAWTMLFNGKIKGVPVVSAEDGRLECMITMEDLIRVPEERRAQMTAGEATSEQPIVTGPEETLDEALTLMSDHDIAFLPVVARDKLVGAVTRRAIVRSVIPAVRRVEEDV